MPIFKKNDLTVFFSHIPKTGGSSIEEYFLQNGFNITLLSGGLYPCSLQHRQYGDKELMMSLGECDINYSFTIIRNPIDRLISGFNMRNPNMDMSKLNNYILDNLKLYRSDNYILDNHIRPQNEFIHSDMEIFKFGEWNKIIDKLNTLYSFNNKFPHENKSKCEKITRSDIPEDVIELIQTFYKKDFILMKNNS